MESLLSFLKVFAELWEYFIPLRECELAVICKLLYCHPSQVWRKKEVIYLENMFLYLHERRASPTRWSQGLWHYLLTFSIKLLRKGRAISAGKVSISLSLCNRCMLFEWLHARLARSLVICLWDEDGILPGCRKENIKDGKDRKNI